jgi:hypothetical protein
MGHGTKGKALKIYMAENGLLVCGCHFFKSGNRISVGQTSLPAGPIGEDVTPTRKILCRKGANAGHRTWKDIVNGTLLVYYSDTPML